MEEGEHQEAEVHHKKGTLLHKVRNNPWIIATVVLGAILVVFLLSNTGRFTGNSVSEEKVTEMMNNYLLEQTGGQATIKEIVPFENNFYQATIEYQGQELSLYVTKDGKYMIYGLSPLQAENPEETQQQTTQEIPKSDKPVVELFVMTHCPYGTQAEKGFIPAAEALGNKVDAKIRFVHYFMHAPEENETPVQVCIRNELGVEKHYEYLKCFLQSGDSEQCLLNLHIKGDVLNCLGAERDRSVYNEDSQISKEYGVEGSPTLVINGQIVNSGRSPQEFLDTICSAFNDKPDECNTKLSTENPSAGFGSGTGSANAAQCG